MLRYAITDRTPLALDERGRQAALLLEAARWAADGLDFVQLRERDLEAAALAELARKMLQTLRTRDPAAKLLIHSRADIAVAIAADGVHLSSAHGTLTPAQVRSLYAAAGLAKPIVSLSCHTLAEIARARTAAATLILFGPAFEKRVADRIVSHGTGLDLLHAACAAAAPIPVLALGGITSETTSACLAAGAAGIAAIRLFSK